MQYLLEADDVGVEGAQHHVEHLSVSQQGCGRTPLQELYGHQLFSCAVLCQQHLAS